MKKFMKAIAFVTVMCMALSTVAFAATEGAVLNGEKVLDITVTGAGNDQVALMVVASDATNFDSPLYIDQKGAEGGVAEFTAVLTNANVDAVDIYVGYATYAATNPKAKKIGEDVALIEGVKTVTVTKIAADAIDNVNGEQQIGAGVWAEVGVKAPAGVEATQMVWAIRYTDPVAGPTVKYSDAMDVTDYHIGNIISGSVKLGFAFLNGFNRAGEEIDPVTITAVDAIFLFEGTVSEQPYSQEVVTNEDDWKNEDPNNK